jgi:hypothetical protein
MATVTIYVDPDASGAGDGSSWEDAYTSLATAAAAKAADIVTAQEIHHYLCRSSGGSADAISTAEIFTGYTTNATYYIIVECVDSPTRAWDTSVYRITYSNKSPLYQSNTSRQGLSQYEGVFENEFPGGTEYFEMDRCHIKGYNGSHGAGVRAAQSAVGDVWLVQNSIFDSCRYGFYGTAGTLYNCTFVNSTWGAYANGAGLGFTNCAFFNNSTADIGVASGSYSYCANTTVTTGTNINLTGYTAAQVFNDPTNGDYFPRAGGPLDGAGATMGTFSYDYQYSTRQAPWAVGFGDMDAVIQPPDLAVAVSMTEPLINSNVAITVPDVAVAVTMQEPTIYVKEASTRDTFAEPLVYIPVTDGYEVMPVEDYSRVRLDGGISFFRKHRPFETETWLVRAQFVVPRDSSYQFLIDRMLAGLPFTTDLVVTSAAYPDDVYPGFEHVCWAIPETVRLVEVNHRGYRVTLDMYAVAASYLDGSGGGA